LFLFCVGFAPDKAIQIIRQPFPALAHPAHVFTEGNEENEVLKNPFLPSFPSVQIIRLRRGGSYGEYRRAFVAHGN
jgi:hypothetical protein